MPLLDDPHRLVRTEAARLLAALPDGEFSADERAARDRALGEFRTSLTVNSDQAGSHMALGEIYEAAGKYGLAAAAYRQAIHVQDAVVGPRTNLAALLDRIGRTKDDEQEAKDLRREELDLMERDVKLLKESGVEDAGLLYRYGMSLYLNKRTDDAEVALRRALELEPTEPQFVAALALLYKELKRWDEAITYCQRYLQLRPNDPGYHQLLRELEEAKKAN